MRTATVTTGSPGCIAAHASRSLRGVTPSLERLTEHYYRTKSSLAMRRALLRTVRVALATVIDARETASMSAPTRKGSRMLLPANCAANAGGSMEKSP